MENLWFNELTEVQKIILEAEYCPHMKVFVDGVNVCDVILARKIVNKEVVIIYCSDEYGPSKTEFYCPYDNGDCDGYDKLCSKCEDDIMEMPML